ncbi:hypothetical protein, partial [uncultured Marinobacter sp.]|uniref:hypothetical protein n=1 Tax=uncultured Marinobacter sp. TaxID=187379 RepID=UPI0025951850
KSGQLIALIQVFTFAGSTQYPKLAGPMSFLGVPYQEKRVALLGADHFRTPLSRDTPQPIQGLLQENLPFKEYRRCDTCPVPLYLKAYGKSKIRILNIEPVYQYGMLLAPGSYIVEIEQEKSGTVYHAEVELSPEVNWFGFQVQEGELTVVKK